jgi:signal peptidase I
MSLFRNPAPEPEEERNERPAEAAPLSLPPTTPPSATPAGQGESLALRGADGYQVYEAERPRSQALKRARRVGWELLQTLVLAAVIFFAVRTLAQNFRVEGSSMEPGLHDGQYLLVNKAIYFQINLDRLSKYIPFIDPGNDPQRYLFRAPKRGDVIVFRFPRDPSRDFIKRVIAAPGDTVEIVNGQVKVNDVPLGEPYIENPGRYDFARQIVPQGSYFVLGDNRNNSFDSHVWGFLPEENIIGQAMVTYWPLSDFGGAGNRSIDLGFVKVPFF